MDYGYGDKRSKKKDKFRERKKHPYKMGGAHRSTKISLSSVNSSGNSESSSSNSGDKSKKKKRR